MRPTVLFRISLVSVALSGALLSGQGVSRFRGMTEGFGEVIEVLDDTDGDLCKEIVIANPGDRMTQAGTVYVFSPNSSIPITTISDPWGDPRGDFGASLANIGDVTGDRVDDFAVGNPESFYLYTSFDGFITLTGPDA